MRRQGWPSPAGRGAVEEDRGGGAPGGGGGATPAKGGAGGKEARRGSEGPRQRRVDPRQFVPSIHPIRRHSPCFQRRPIPTVFNQSVHPTASPIASLIRIPASSFLSVPRSQPAPDPGCIEATASRASASPVFAGHLNSSSSHRRSQHRARLSPQQQRSPEQPKPLLVRPVLDPAAGPGPGCPCDQAHRETTKPLLPSPPPHRCLASPSDSGVRLMISPPPWISGCRARLDRPCFTSLRGSMNQRSATASDDIASPTSPVDHTWLCVDPIQQESRPTWPLHQPGPNPTGLQVPMLPIR
ncbi:uncharacterized protein [Triticum aestivum]|uniref:uncharacterized protein n=1 Tax=Triticum aestivum TaxID=4565 RepID=UPI001D022890|nr:uncharacterized protein LOC123083810 [Triticum aestivum]